MTTKTKTDAGKNPVSSGAQQPKLAPAYQALPCVAGCPYTDLGRLELIPLSYLTVTTPSYVQVWNERFRFIQINPTFATEMSVKLMDKNVVRMPLPTSPSTAPSSTAVHFHI